MPESLGITLSALVDTLDSFHDVLKETSFPFRPMTLRISSWHCSDAGSSSQTPLNTLKTLR